MRGRLGRNKKLIKKGYSYNTKIKWYKDDIWII